MSNKNGVSASVSASSGKKKNGDSWLPVVARSRSEELRREVVEASTLFLTLRGLALHPAHSPLPPLGNESKLMNDVLQVAKRDLCEAMSLYLGERLENSETKKRRDEKRALVRRIVEFLKENRSTMSFNVMDFVDNFLEQDGLPEK